ncbi:PTS sugar transporter subunit IIB [Thermoanaerobacterium thermosaccharolyticum]|uniref:PTS sugar transporter subunit IIB n=1 Tax=Thermoanaerobacterium thermosaccharolyticum TaxID=1517 RepID=UPI0020A588FE|nr:PTS sugar transporter subunit IIB [Thermoanaerobacterium thermosaccharolyticum]
MHKSIKIAKKRWLSVNKLKILTVCGVGSGTSLILRMTVEDILRENGIKAEVSACDAGTAVSEPCDLILTSKEIAKIIRRDDVPVVIIDNFINKNEISGKLMPFIK